jgi:hypothetical protein
VFGDEQRLPKYPKNQGLLYDFSSTSQLFWANRPSPYSIFAAKIPVVFPDSLVDDSHVSPLQFHRTLRRLQQLR